MRLALYQPDIPQNLGAAIRLTAALEVALDIIEPCGFPLNDKAIKRAAMDYGGCAKVSHHAGWADFLAFLRGERDARL
ncbi:MAG: tRNA (cytidine(34)-2'-O)-methyltransferase, partial [Asticcacaulis sp.]|nr:tRNA (cytidine(34)-2'-O)-methyltransferase [Asticcacaulis sp.]